MAEFIYVDNSNIFIEGKRIAAIRQGLAKNAAHANDNGIVDHTFRLDFGELYDFVADYNPGKVARAVLFGSSPPESDKVWEIAQRVGFEAIVVSRNAVNQEKKVDTGIVAAMVRDAYTRADKTKDTITLVAGDSDYVPAVELLTADGFRVEVVFWSSASSELKSVCSKFIELDRYLERLEY
ncbi:MAG: NYN domain-containing protein [Acidobacteriota bacterium]|nr:NYN domain-containing protein [Acidobacteriota bacterium]